MPGKHAAPQSRALRPRLTFPATTSVGAHRSPTSGNRVGRTSSLAAIGLTGTLALTLGGWPSATRTSRRSVPTTSPSCQQPATAAPSDSSTRSAESAKWWPSLLQIPRPVPPSSPSPTDRAIVLSPRRRRSALGTKPARTALARTTPPRATPARPPTSPARLAQPPMRSSTPCTGPLTEHPSRQTRSSTRWSTPPTSPSAVPPTSWTASCRSRTTPGAEPRKTPSPGQHVAFDRVSRTSNSPPAPDDVSGGHLHGMR